MNQLLYITVLLLAFTIQKQVDAEETEITQRYKTFQKLGPQIKVTGFRVDYLNHKYATIYLYALKQHNATYNNVQKRMSLNRDYPPVSVSVDVFATNAYYTNAKHLLGLKLPICTESRYRQLLPKALVVPETMLNDVCLKKGDLNTDDFGVFRFEVLIPNIHMISSYYRIDYMLHTDDSKELITKETLFAESGYLYTDY